MRDFAGDLRATPELRDDLTDDEVADVLWSMNAAAYWVLEPGPVLGLDRRRLDPPAARVRSTPRRCGRPGLPGCWP
jgi:hypothetical protein